MVNRSILNQNTNSRNILNIRPQKLLDGKAIKISDRNEIDVNFVNNIDQSLTLSNFDLFLISDNTGVNVKFISARTIKEAVNDYLVAGDNINFSIYFGPGGNQRQINVDSALTSITSINGYNANVLTLNNSNQQFLVKDTSKSFVSNDIVGLDTDNKLTPILTRNGLNSTSGYLEIATNPIIETPTFTIKNSTSNCVLSIVSGNSTSYESKLLFTNNSAERARIVYSSINNKWDFLTLDGAIHLKAYKDTNDGTSRLLLDDGTFHLQAGSASISLTDIIRGDLNEIRQNRKVKIEPSADNYTDNDFMLHIESYADKACKVCIESDIVNTFVSKETSLIFKNHFIQADLGLNVDNKLYLHHPSTNTSQSRVEFFLGSATKDTNSLIFELTTDEIKQNRKVKIEPLVDNYTDNDFMLHIESYADKACKVCIQSDIINTFVSKETSLIFKNHFIQADIGLNVDNKLYLHHPSTNTNQSRVEFFLGSAIKDSNSLIFELTPTFVNMYKPLDMRENIIYLKGDGNVNHYIKFTDVANVINGPRISGFGGAGRAVFDIVSQETTTDKVLFSVSNDKIDVKNPLYMNSTTTDDRPLYLHNNTDFFIKYQNTTGQNVVECRGYNGVHLGSIAANAVNLKVEQDRVEITKMRVIDFINLDNKEIRLRAADDPWQILGYKNDAESISGSNINIDGWFMRGWNGGRLASVQGIFPPFESNSIHHAVWYMSNNLPRFGGPYGYHTTSDDRIKFEETTITNALQTINKLNPVMYKKGKYIGDTDYDSMKLESGFVAQEVYNNVPEMRHLVDFDKSLSRNFVNGDLSGDCVEDIYSKKTDSNGITHEKPELCSVSYDEVIPFAIKAIQELHILVNTLQDQLITQSALISNLQSQINNI